MLSSLDAMPLPQDAMPSLQDAMPSPQDALPASRDAMPSFGGRGRLTPSLDRRGPP
jgi:hypothetical protein